MIVYKETILLIEDSEFNIKLVEAVLKPHGYRLLVARDGETGITLTKSAKPDLILMDLLLPGIDGYEATRRLRADPETQDITIVALTASTTPEQRQQVVTVGCDGYIAKPFDTRAFPKQIREFLNA